MSTGSRNPSWSAGNILIPPARTLWAAETEKCLSPVQCCRPWRFTAWRKSPSDFPRASKDSQAFWRTHVQFPLTGSVNPNLIRSFEIPTCKIHTFCDLISQMSSISQECSFHLLCIMDYMKNRQGLVWTDSSSVPYTNNLLPPTSQKIHTCFQRLHPAVPTAGILLASQV